MNRTNYRRMDRCCRRMNQYNARREISHPGWLVSQRSSSTSLGTAFAIPAVGQKCRLDLRESAGKIVFSDGFDILFEKRLSGVDDCFDKLRTDKDILLFMGNPRLRNRTGGYQTKRRRRRGIYPKIR